MEMYGVFASKVIQVHPNVNVVFHVSFLLFLCCCANIFIYKRIIVTIKNNAVSQNENFNFISFICQKNTVIQYIASRLLPKKIFRS